MRPNRPVMLRLGAVVLAFFAVISIANFHRYAYAVAWHCLHGGRAQVAGHTITLPLLWWEEKDPSHWDTYLLKRAYTGMRRLQPPEITVRHVIPALQSTVKDSDQDALASEQSRVSTLNALLTHNSRISGLATLFTIRAKSMTLYCTKLEANVSGVRLSAIITCRAARTLYSFDFFASAQQQEEDKSILSTLE